MDIPIRHLSASSVQDYLVCPMRWFGRRIAKWAEVKPPFFQAAAATGRVVHRAISAHHRGEDADVELVRCWVEETGSVTGFTSISTVIALLRAYTSVIVPHPDDRPDLQFSFEIPGVPVPIIGFVDLLNGSHVREFKTTSSQKNWTQQDVDTAIQGSIYWAAVQAAKLAQRPRLTYSILRVGGDPVMTELETERSDGDIRDLEYLIRETYERMTDGDNLKACCKPGACSFPTECAQYGYVKPERSSGPAAQTLRASRPDSVSTGVRSPA